MQYKLIEISDTKFNSEFIKQMRTYMNEVGVDKLVLSMPVNGISTWMTIVGETDEDKDKFDNFNIRIGCYLADDLPDLFCRSEESLPVCNYVNDIRKVVDPWSRYMLTLDRLYEIM